MSDTRRVVTVTRLQVEAAKVAIEADRRLGRESDPRLLRIANAKPAQPAPENSTSA